ncbi:MAG: helicase-related protein [Cumulibacter sp.]
MELLQTLDAQERPATDDEQLVLAQWSSWGAAPHIFEPHREEFAADRDRLKELLSPAEYAAAERTVLNAHYTDPRLVSAMWDGLREAGFTGGRVLEPGCGTGTFIGFAPDTADMTGIELDPATARIAGYLYPDAEIRAESYAESKIPEGYFDAAIGNVPFGENHLHDRMHNPKSAYPMHDHFILKALAHTRPGGYVTVLTSSWTLDKQDPAARRHMGMMADLVTAVRLPRGAHRRTAGTDVVTDVLVLRRRAAGEPARGYSFEQVEQVTLPNADGEPRTVRVNELFNEPDSGLVLGDMVARVDRFGKDVLDVRPREDRDVAEDLRTVLTSEIHASATEEGLAWTERGPLDKQPVALLPSGMERAEGLIEAHDDGTFTVIHDGAQEPYDVPKTQADELASLLQLRDTYLRLVQLEAADRDDTPAMVAARDQLNAIYDQHVQRHGFISAVRWVKTGKVDEDGEPVLRAQQRRMGGFRKDTFAGVVLGLERWDQETETATKADIFTERLILPRELRLSADTPHEAVALCLDTKGHLDSEEIARLLGEDDPEAVINAMIADGIVFERPEGGIVPRAEYLSGHVRIKLREAQQAAEQDPERWTRNVEALREVLPDDLEPDDIHVQLGGWVGRETVQEFLRDISGTQTVTVTNPGGQNWKVGGIYPHTTVASETWGTQDYPLGRLAEALLNHKKIQVIDRSVDPPVVDVAATEAAEAKAVEVQERFSDWAWEDADRAKRLAGEYNERFNGLRLREYDGRHLTFPGLTTSMVPLSHQRAAVDRMINEPTVGLFHVVGAGKTLEMVMGVQELRRLAMVRKPAVCVPNHLVGQVVSEWQQAYPAAKVLAASMENLGSTPQHRQRFLSMVTANDWDAIIFSREAFKKIPLSPEHAAAHLEAETEQLRRWVESAAEQGASSTAKRLQTKLQAAEEKVKKKLDANRDAGLTFEQTGIDYIVVDEAHDYKNLRTPSENSDLAIDGSQRADDMLMKINYLRSQHGQRVATFATGTPVANSLTELHVMQRYLRPDLLEKANLPTFDDWAGTFTQPVTKPELKPAGGGWRVRSRIAKFHNVPELLTMFHTFGDIKMAEDLNLPRPAVAEGGTQTVLVPASAELETIAADAAARAERGGRSPEDNLLAIMTRLRHAALDVRTLGHDTTERQKVHLAADNIHAIWRDSAQITYADHPRPGALQIVFSDLSVPKGDGQWNVYEELKTQLIAKGMSPDSIAFVHEANSDDEKRALWARCRSGEVNVIIGSTARMGTGTNIQDRAIALHHLDPSWRPADIEQREGRIIRRGNLNREVQIYAYTTEGSMDAYMWGTVTRKATFIGQIMRGSLDIREIEDLAENAVSAGQITAITSGEPLLMEQAEVQTDVQRLTRLERNHANSQRRIESTIASNQRAVARLERDERSLDAAIEQRQDTRGDAFRAEVAGHRTDKRPVAGELLAAQVHQHVGRALRHRSSSEPESVGSLGGHAITVQAVTTSTGYKATFAFAGVPRSAFSVDRDQLKDGAGVITRLENRLAAMESTRADVAAERHDAQREIEDARAQLGAPFKDAATLEAKRRRLAEIAGELRAKAAKKKDPERPHKDLDGQELADRVRVADQRLRLGDVRGPAREHVQMLRDELRAEQNLREAERAAVLRAEPPAVDHEIGAPSIER